MSDADEWCETLGCESDPVDGEEYCRECIDTSPGLIDDPDTVGKVVNPAGGASGRVESTGSPDTTSESVVEPETGGATPTPDTGETAFADAVEWFHSQLDHEIADHTEAGEHPDRPTTARDYFHEVRGWTDETIADALLGYAPASGDALLNHLKDEGFGRDAILGTGLFTEDLRPLWQGRYVLPYFDADGEPVYAISRTTGDKGGGAVGYDGHPADGMSGKYAKPAHTKEYANVEEPIFGLSSVEAGEPVLITEGIADAITAHEAGYACLSPVTTRFKHRDREALQAVLESHDVPRVYVVQDAERPSSDLADDGVLSLTQVGEGLRGALDTAAYLAEYDTDALVAELPRSGLAKVDLDAYLRGWADTLAPVLAAAKPAREHPAHDPKEAAIEAARSGQERTGGIDSSGEHSALYDLGVLDVAGVSEDYRGPNPLGHHGESEKYTVVVGSGRDGVLFDHKHKTAYNALTYLLVEAGERRADSPGGRLDDSEVFAAWRQAKADRAIPDDDPIPHRALRHVALDAGLCESGDVEDGWKLPAEAYNGALDALREEYGVEPGRGEIRNETGGSQQFTVKKCKPPVVDAEPFDKDERRNELYDRYQAWVDDGRPVRVWGDAAGAGKTTTATLAADAAGRPHALLADKHTKGHEHVDGDVTPDGYHHLKGAAQPVHDCCMRAAAAAGPEETSDCPEHGHPADWPRMCPVYERAKDDDLRQRYDALVSAVGPIGAHIKLDLFESDEHTWHGEECRWSEALGDLNEADTEYVAGVHEHQTLKTVGEGEAIGERDLIVDEKPRGTGRTATVDVEGLTRMASRLADLAGAHAHADADFSHNLREFAEFTDRIRDAIVSDEAVGLADAEAPDLRWEQRRELKDPISGAYVERSMKDETLAQVKLAYMERTINRVQDGEWNGEPLYFDALLAAAVEAGIASEPARRAIAAPNAIDSCPWCGGDLASDNGLRFCPEEGCGWHEGENTVTGRDDDPARAVAWLQGEAPNDAPALGFRTLPPATDMPDRGPLVLDATATRERIAGVYGERVENVDVEGTQTPALEGLNLTQIADGQYHAGTIKQSDAAKRRIQRAIDAACAAYDQPLFGIKRELKPIFRWPDNAEILFYGAARGLNKTECDAVVAIGAPHPNMKDIQRTARLFAQDHPDLEAGGEELSTRQENGELAAKPPVYRKLRYEDENGDGRAVPTKAYTGVAGKLFREVREKELVQFIHRVRPLLAGDGDQAKDGYLLTNVPTDLPVSEFCEFDELADDLAEAFPASDGALRLLEYANDVLHGDAPDGFRAGTVGEYDADAGELTNTVEGWHRLARANGEGVKLRTVRNWVNDLADAGLLTDGEYIQNEGVGYSASRAASKTALTVLSINASFEAASHGLSRRFRAKVEAADHAAEWIAWAGKHLSIAGAAGRAGGPGEVRADAGDPPPE